MKFINKGGPIKIRIGESHECYWTTVKTNEIIDLSAEQGLKLGFTEIKTTEGQIGTQVVETKQIVTFLEELQSINGIGKKTAEDIVGIFKTKSELFKHMENDQELPLRNDAEIKLRSFYGK